MLGVIYDGTHLCRSRPKSDSWLLLKVGGPGEACLVGVVAVGGRPQPQRLSGSPF
jgi:hypothetical protein